MNTATISIQISKYFIDLSPQLKVAAQYVLDNPQNVAMRSLRHIANESDLAPPTFSRLARAIGYEDYEAMRDSCRTEVEETHLSLADRAALLQKTDNMNPKEGHGSFAAIHAQSSVKSIQKLLDGLDLNQLAEAAKLLVESERVRLIGFLSSRTMIEYLHYMAQMLTDNWQVAGHGSLSVPATLAELNVKDTVLVIAVSPYSNETVKAVKFAAEAGTKLIIITDRLDSPVLKYGYHNFVISTESTQFFPSHVAIITLLEILVGMLVRRLGEDGKNRINAVEQTNHAIGDYWKQ